MKFFPIKKCVANKKNTKVCDFYSAILNFYKLLTNCSFGKDCKFLARNKSRKRKEILQNTSEVISDKQSNLEELVAEYECEENARKQANKAVALHEVAKWLSTLKNREDFQIRLKSAQEERQNIEIAERYFDKLKRKNITDAQFLREKSFHEQHLNQIQTEIDYQEIYDKTKNMRRVVDAYNLQNIKK